MLFLTTSIGEIFSSSFEYNFDGFKESIRNRFFISLSIFSLVITVAIDYMDIEYGTLVLIVLVFLTTTTAIYSIYKKNNIENEIYLETSELENDNIQFRERLEGLQESIPESYLEKIYNDMKLGDNDRITLYEYQEKNKSLRERFTVIARYSSNLSFSRKSDRESYPVGEGFISKGWEDNSKKGYFFVELKNKYDINPRDYINESELMAGLSEETIENLNMKSTSFFLKKVPNKPSNSNSSRKIGIIVIESLDNFSINKIETINSLLNGNDLMFLIDIYKIFGNGNGGV